MERTCHRCPKPTFVIFEAKPWCRGDFLAEVDARDDAKDTDSDSAS